MQAVWLLWSVTSRDEAMLISHSEEIKYLAVAVLKLCLSASVSQ